MAQASPNFSASQTVEVTAEAVSVDTAASTVRIDGRRKDEEKELLLSTKLHSDLLEAYHCWKSKQANCAGVKDGKVRVEVWLEPSVRQGDLERLFRAGLNPEQDKSQIVGAKLTSVRGTIDVNKLPNLAKQKGVRLVSLAK
jgi:hypothetical protein